MAVNDSEITRPFKATVTVAVGDVVIVDTANPGQVTTTTTAADTKVLGVVVAAALAGQLCEVALPGSIAPVNCTAAAITAGQLLQTSTTAKLAAGALVTVAGGAIFGKALAPKAVNATSVLALVK